MKKTFLSLIIISSSLFCCRIMSQNDQTPGSLGLPGDNLNLYGVLSLFQSSATLEEFEHKLNAEDSKINNLDLNGDGKTDYIKVFDNVNGNAHAIVLQDMINEKESQDVAVIEVEKDKNNQVQIQIIGDEQLYGKDYIIEPSNGTPNPGFSGNSNSNAPAEGNATIVNNYNDNGGGYAYTVGTWGIIGFLFAPTYAVYASPWRWGYYPSYWRPWHPVYYNDYYGHWYNHPGYAHFHQSYAYHVPMAHSYYAPRRTTSVVVHQRIVENSAYHHNNVQSRPANNARPVNHERPVVNQRQSSSVHNSTQKSVTPSHNNTNARPSGQTQNTRPAAVHNNKPATTQSNRPAANQGNKSSGRPAANNRPATNQNKKAADHSEHR